MTDDLLARAVQAERTWRKARAAYDQASAERREAIVAAYRAGHTLHEIAAALGVTHEAPRRIVRAAGL